MLLLAKAAFLRIGGRDAPRTFSISPSVSGRSEWNLDADGPLVLSVGGVWTITPTATFAVSAKLWGSSGATSGGGGGGFGGGAVTLTKDVGYTLTVGDTSSFGGPGSGSPNGGGFTGIRLESNGDPILIAGGGGGPQDGGTGPAGGGLTGEDNGGLGGQHGQRGTQSAGGAAAAGATDGSAFQGGNGWSPGAGGGGGYFGGGGGGSDGGLGRAGGGGSGYKNDSIVLDGVLTAGSGTQAGNRADPDREISGEGGMSGRLRLA